MKKLTDKDIKKLLNKMDWAFVNGVRDTMAALGKTTYDGDMKQLGRSLLKDLHKSKTTLSIRSGLLVARRNSNEVYQEYYTLTFEPEKVSTEY